MEARSGVGRGDKVIFEEKNALAKVAMLTISSRTSTSPCKKMYEKSETVETVECKVSQESQKSHAKN